jgi:hypothetical protein
MLYGTLEASHVFNYFFVVIGSISIFMFIFLNKNIGQVDLAAHLHDRCVCNFYGSKVVGFSVAGKIY